MESSSRDATKMSHRGNTSEISTHRQTKGVNQFDINDKISLLKPKY